MKINNICKTFITSEGENHALKNVSFQIPQGKCTVIGGENGSGKSVLMSIIAGLEDSDSGSIEFDENQSSNQVGLVFQEAETQILGETPREDIAFGLKNQGLKKVEIESLVEEALEKTGLTSKADYPARFLSGGEKRRLAVACMLAMKLPVIILDEPYANLDFGGVKQVNQLIRQLKSENKTIVILTHEPEKCLAFADNFVVLFRGEKVFEGSAEEGLKSPLENWNIHNPITSYSSIKDLVW